jgi:hypothetical protein
MKFLLVIITAFLSFSSLLAQNRYDIVIDEIMADPAPQIGLPNSEWIELKNTSSVAINLQNWRIGDASSQSGPMQNFILQPDSFVIVCSSSAVTALSVFGNTITVTSFPSLDNDDDQLYLKAANGKIIHAVSYSSAWYKNELKKDGGWTLEMVDTKSPCEETNNWKASISSTGGTPGKKNSVDALNNDQSAPDLKTAYTINATTIILEFDEPVDSLKAATINNYTIDGGISFINATTLPPLFKQVQLKINSSLLPAIVYTIIASNITDCKNNIIGSNIKIKVGLPQDAVAGDWIINEILFDPRPNGFDYVEFYNKSQKILDASKLYIANRNSSGVVSSLKQLSTSPRYIFPGEYIVLTEDAANLAMNYFVKDASAVLEVSSLPSFPDDEGDVIALNFQGVITDEVKYKDDWHFKLIENTEGVSLERIDPDGHSQNEANWHSAASTAGYGTPGYKNSQYKNAFSITAAIEVNPKVFSPDNDGHDDIATIQYKLTEPGYIANITVFDAAGRPVRNLVQNGTMGSNGSWNWDGLDEKGRKLAIGTYIIFTEMFNLSGKKQSFKNVVVLVRKL